MLPFEQVLNHAPAMVVDRFTRRWLLLLATLAAVFQVDSTRAAAGGYALKAESLYNVSEFAEWPATAFARTNAPFVIGILGKDPFGHDLENALRNKAVNAHPLVIQHFRQVDEIINCEILFISPSESKLLPRILAGLKGRSILTMSDMGDFTSRGGMVRLMNAANRVEFEVNLEVLKTAGLSMRSQFLRMAKIVSSANQ